MVTVATVFFSTFMAIGLQKILEHLDEQKWLCFLVAFTLFLRFLLGSANQLWDDYVRVSPSREARNCIPLDFVWLIAFGLVGLLMCYANSAEHFLIWCGVFGMLAIVAPIYDTWRRHRIGKRASDFFFKWLIINFSFTVAVGLTYLWYTAGPERGRNATGWSRSFSTLTLVSLALLIFDIYHQLNALYSGQNKVKDDRRTR